MVVCPGGVPPGIFKEGAMAQRIRLTCILEYDANPADYPTGSTLDLMAATDLHNVVNNPSGFEEIRLMEDVSVRFDARVSPDGAEWRPVAGGKG